MKKNICILSLGVVSFFAGIKVMLHIKENEVRAKNDKAEKFRCYYEILLQWLRLKQSDKKICDYFKKNGYKNIAIYGMGELGCRLFDELKDSNVHVKYGIDNNAESINAGFPIVKLDNNIDSVDVIVVTAIFSYDEIKENLLKKTNNKIVSLAEIIYEI